MSRLPRSRIAAILLLAWPMVSGCAKLPDPLAQLTRELARYPEYSVVLEDMDVTGNFFKSYHHKYQVLIGEDPPPAAAGSPAPETAGSQTEESQSEGSQTEESQTEGSQTEGSHTEGSQTAGPQAEAAAAAPAPGLAFRTQVRNWVEVDKSFFKKYEPLLGMVVLSKGADSNADRANFPPGYQYVGNPGYGTWRRDSRGGSFWEFYGQYAFFSHLLGSGRRPIYAADYDAYRRSRSQRRAYYGPSNNYGTRGSYTRTSRPDFYQRQQVRQRSQNERFAKKVRSRASSSRSRSAGRGK